MPPLSNTRATSPKDVRLSARQRDRTSKRHAKCKMQNNCLWCFNNLYGESLILIGGSPESEKCKLTNTYITIMWRPRDAQGGALCKAAKDIRSAKAEVAGGYGKMRLITG